MTLVLERSWSASSRRIDGLRADLVQTGSHAAESARPSRATWREPARWKDVCLAWWKNDILHGVAARLIAIGPRSAVIVSADVPPAPYAIRFCLEGYEPSQWLRARVASSQSMRNGLSKVRLVFLPEPVPADLLLAAVRGS
jgi:hypothetical protein